MTRKSRPQAPHEAHLTHRLACRAADSRGRCIAEPPDGLRTCFERDGHRILHAKAFRRLRNKTQVFFSPENDHIATRMDHSLYVATIARTICRNLGLNDDLAFAAALGHDLGHAPYGHSGEHLLEHLLARYRVGTAPVEYTHEGQSLRVVDALSTMAGRAFVGLNLTYEVRDAIRCHCGESRDASVRPRDPADTRDPSTFTGRATAPITLEGCVVRMADRIAYLGRDYEDAQIALADVLPPLPAVVVERLGDNNRELINALVRDVIGHNRAEPEAIGFSEPIFEAMLALRDFNYRHIYLHERLEDYRVKIDAILTHIFETLLAHLQRREPASWATVEPGGPRHLAALAHFVAGARYETVPDAVEVVADFICLMTDGFAFKMYKSIVLPEAIV